MELLEHDALIVLIVSSTNQIYLSLGERRITTDMGKTRTLYIQMLLSSLRKCKGVSQGLFYPVNYINVIQCMNDYTLAAEIYEIRMSFCTPCQMLIANHEHSNQPPWRRTG